MLPLYRGVAVPHSLDRGNAGLWVDKFCNAWDSSFSAMQIAKRGEPPEADLKRAWLATFCANVGSQSTVGDEQQLKVLDDRRTALVAALGGISDVFEASSRLVIGTGNPNPLENGMQWHHTLGVPYVPGSSLKGLTRSWATLRGIDEPEVARIFGDDDATGSVLFLDGIPWRPTALEVDVLTPHYKEYYEARDAAEFPPADWYDPVPIAFVGVAAGSSFRFAVVPRNGEAAKGMQSAFDLVVGAVAEYGVGAKTASGYGRLRRTLGEVPQALARPRTPRYNVGDEVAVTRVEDPKNRGRVWFEADDGFGGVVTGGAPPNVEMGGTSFLRIASVNNPPSYNFSLPRAKERRNS